MSVRLLLFAIIAIIVCIMAFNGRPMYLLGFLIVIYFVFPQKYIWGINEYRVVSLLTIVAFFCVIKECGIPVLNEKITFLMILLMLSVLIAAFFAEVDRDRAIGYAVLFMKVVFFWLLLKTAFNSYENIEYFYWVCILSTTFLACWGVQQYLLGNTRLEDFGGGQIAGSNQIASVFVWVLPIAYYKILSEKSKLRILAVFAFLTLLAGIVCTESRQAFLAVLVMGILVTIVSKYKGRIFFGALFLATIITFLSPPAYFDRMGTIKNYEEDGSAVGRIQQWVGALEMVKDFPLLGVGGDNFTLVIEKYSGHSRESHNTFIQVLSEEGLPGLTIFLLLIFFTIRSLASISKNKIPFSKESENKVYYISNSARLGLIGLLVCCVFQNKLEHEFLYWASAVAVALNNIQFKNNELTGEPT